MKKNMPASIEARKNTRRDFLRHCTTAGMLTLATATGLRANSDAQQKPKHNAGRTENTRDCWTAITRRVAAPVLNALAARRLRALMPVETAHPQRNRTRVTHLEALGRLLCGIAPWLELADDNTPESRERIRFASLAREAINAATDPNSPDFMVFDDAVARQPLVDAAFLAQALLRAPRELWLKLDPRVKNNVVSALKSTRVIQPAVNNWLLFSSMVEAFLHRAGEQPDSSRLFDGPRTFRDQWYCGDAWYADGPEFHTDYYNSYVIHPMLVDILDVLAPQWPEWEAFRDTESARFTRYAEIQERMIAPDGSFPAVGRSIAYRCGAFQVLAQAALRGQLPANVTPAQARVALTSVIRRTMEAPGTFDSNDWLALGLCGHQPSLSESYISTGSLYLCSVAFLPLGLPPANAFWSAPDAPTTWEKTWTGTDVPADKALRQKR